MTSFETIREISEQNNGDIAQWLREKIKDVFYVIEKYQKLLSFFSQQ